MQIVIEPLVTQKQVELVKALISKGYFATDAAAFAYADAISKFIASLPRQTVRRTKDTAYGHYYASYNANRHITWYILLDVSGEKYIVRNLINNHTNDYPTFIASLK